MPILPVAENIDNRVIAELLPESHGKIDSPCHMLRTIAVHVENRNRHRFGNIGTEKSGTGIPRGGGKPDLVVDDDMDSTAGLVTSKLRKVESL